MNNRPELVLEELSVEEVGLSVRTSNALFNSGICTAKELSSLSMSDLRGVRGLGAKAFDEIEEFWEKCKKTGDSFLYKTRQRYTPSEYLLLKKTTEGQLDILASYYNKPSTTLQNVSDGFNITRERVRQIVKKTIAKLRGGILSGSIRNDFLETIETCATIKTEIRAIELADYPFDNIGVARMIADAIPERYEIFKDRRINGYWLVHAEDNVSAMFDRLYDELRYDSAPLYIPNIVELYSINEEMIWSIDGIQEKDGYVTLKTNRVSMGMDRTTKVSDYLESIGRPASIWQIADGANMTLNQVRGALQDKSCFANVGKSIYDLADRDYSDASIEELARNILLASDCALKLKHIIEYVRRYKTIGNISVMWALDDSLNFYKWEDYYLLNEWPLSKIKKTTREPHSIKIKDAVLDLINSSDEIFDSELIRDRLIDNGIDATTNPSSIKATLAKLAADGEIKRVWGGNGCYVHN